jgi:hypothetical protein
VIADTDGVRLFTLVVSGIGGVIHAIQLRWGPVRVTFPMAMTDLEGTSGRCRARFAVRSLRTIVGAPLPSVAQEACGSCWQESVYSLSPIFLPMVCRMSSYLGDIQPGPPTCSRASHDLVRSQKTVPPSQSYMVMTLCKVTG